MRCLLLSTTSLARRIQLPAQTGRARKIRTSVFGRSVASVCKAGGQVLATRAKQQSLSMCSVHHMKNAAHTCTLFMR